MIDVGEGQCAQPVQANKFVVDVHGRRAGNQTEHTHLTALGLPANEFRDLAGRRDTCVRGAGKNSAGNSFVWDIQSLFTSLFRDHGRPQNTRVISEHWQSR